MEVKSKSAFTEAWLDLQLNAARKEKKKTTGLRLNTTGSLGSFAVVTIQVVGGCGSGQRKKHSNVFSVHSGERGDSSEGRGLHHQFD